MPLILLVHGAWQSAACWDGVICRLADLGKRGAAVALSGLGTGTAHLDHKIGLSTHIEDVVAAIDSAGERVVLVGHSYAGMVVTGACARRPDQVLGIVYVEGFVPRDGQSALQLLPAAIAQSFQTIAREQGGGWRLPAGDFLLDVWGTRDPAHRAKVRSDFCDFSIRCFEQALDLPGGQTQTTPRGYIVGGLKHEYPARTAFQRFVDEACVGGWLLAQLDAGHTCEVEKPAEVAQAIVTFVDEVPAAATA